MCKKCICTYLLPTSVHPRCWPVHTVYGLPSATQVLQISIKGKTKKKRTPTPFLNVTVGLNGDHVNSAQTSRCAEAALTPPSSPLSFYFKVLLKPTYVLPPPIKKNPGSREFTEIRHISLYCVYKNAFIPTSDSARPIMHPCTWISYLPCEYLLLSSPIYASIFADAVVIGPQRSTLQWRLHLHRDVLYGITFFIEKKFNVCNIKALGGERVLLWRAENTKRADVE